MLNSLLKKGARAPAHRNRGSENRGRFHNRLREAGRAAPRCPVCGRRCAAYDRLGPALEGARPRRRPLLLEHAPAGPAARSTACAPRPSPRARCASSRIRASAFEDWVAWLALHMCRSALAELARVDWHRRGICARVEASLEEADGRGRLDGLRRIGVDETSYKKGQRYMTVVVDHDRGGRVGLQGPREGHVSVNIFFTIFTNVFSPIAPTRMRRIRQRGCAAFGV